MGQVHHDRSSIVVVAISDDDEPLIDIIWGILLVLKVVSHIKDTSWNLSFFINNTDRMYNSQSAISSFIVVRIVRPLNHS